MTSAGNTDVLIVGAGLAGLTAALLLHEAGRSVRVLEARERVGGRIHSVFNGAGTGFVADLGPTWIWTPYQPVARRWLEKLELEAFAQYEQGDGLVDQSENTQPVAYPMPGQHGSMRVAGGSQAIVDRLLTLLPADAVKTSHPVSEVHTVQGGVEVIGGAKTPQVFRASRVVVAVPPRLAAAAIDWRPGLPEKLLNALQSTATWMAPHAKAVAVYERAFWRDRNLSGRLASRVGPLVEAHDHCGPQGQPSALFGFVGWPPEAREKIGADALHSAIDVQLTRCFGKASPRPLTIHVHDWARCPYTTSTQDLTGPMAHPSVGPEIVRAPHCDGRVWFCASETADLSPGLIEGAFAGAQHAVSSMFKEP